MSSGRDTRRTARRFLGNGFRKSWGVGLVLLGFVLAGCAAFPQIYSSTHYRRLGLTHADLVAGGVAFLTPSTVTGQEEEKQAVAFVFAETLEKERPTLSIVSLSKSLSRINQAGMVGDYMQMLADYRDTGIFKEDILKEIAHVVGARYLFQLKLAGFQQGSANRLGVFGLRVIDTKYTNVRLFSQIWDAKTGAIVWEGNQELNYAFDTIAERTVTLREALHRAAENLIARLP